VRNTKQLHNVVGNDNLTDNEMLATSEAYQLKELSPQISDE
jgi:hypothetical protein